MPVYDIGSTGTDDPLPAGRPRPTWLVWVLKVRNSTPVVLFRHAYMKELLLIKAEVAGGFQEDCRPLPFFVLIVQGKRKACLPAVSQE
jgi:hypothetical protein